MTSTAVFFLHGSGDTGPNLRLYMDSLPIETFDFKTFTQVSQENGITVYTPSSGTRKYTPAFGSSMNVWFDRSADFNCLGLEDTYEDQEGISKSLDMLLHEVEKVQHNYYHVFIGGFSMGGGLCLNLLRQVLSPKVLGIFCLSSYLIDSSSVLTNGELPSTVPVMMMHGDQDSLIKCAWGEATGANLLMLGAEVQFRKYEGLDHELCPEELGDLMHWMQDLIEINRSNRSNIDASPKYMKKAVQTTNKLQEKLRTDTLPYHIETINNEEGKYIFKYPCPSELVDVLVARQVLCRGSCFDITRSMDGNAVQTCVSTTDPEGTAVEIGKRLLFRVNSGEDGNFNPCPMS